MLKIWEPLEDSPFDGYEALSRQEALLVRDTARHFLGMLDYEDDVEMQEIIDRALTICRLSGIEINRHFRKIFIQSAEGLRDDFLLTDLACYLLAINADAGHPAVAQAQVYFLRSRV